MTAPIPQATATGFATTATAFFLPLGFGQDAIDAAVQTFLGALCGKAKPDHEPDQMLTAREVAERLHRSTKTVRTLARSGAIRRVCCGVGGQRASGYSARSVEQFLGGEKAEG